MTPNERGYQRVTRRVRVHTPHGWQWASAGDVIYSDGQENDYVLTGVEAEQVHFIDCPPDHIADASKMVEPDAMLGDAALVTNEAEGEREGNDEPEKNQL